MHLKTKDSDDTMELLHPTQAFKHNLRAMNTQYHFVSVLGYKLFSDNLIKIPLHSEKCRTINCMSPNSYSLALRDEECRNALRNTDFLVLDGVYFALASILLQGRNIKRNQGPDVFRHFIERLNKESGRAFFLGSSDAVLEKIKERLGKEYPGITAGSYSPPFKKEFSDEDNQEMIAKINAFGPDVLFVGMTAPKQEKWAVRMQDHLDASLVISIGNVFDWYAGTQKTIHPFFFKIRMGWLVRIFLRPEMIRRNLGNQMLFFWHIMLMALKLKKQPR
jgi:N-acetylglucosaminyldiphosphoundecaprenol N-acetyl-beta-D-mannosaminyltransferase